MFRPTGAYTAIVTPMTDTGEIDEAGLRALVDHQIDGGIDGLVPCGTTGESATLSADEKIRVFEIVMDQASGRVPIVAGTGSYNTRSSVELTRRAHALGVDAVLAVCPYYNKPNPEGIYQHFMAIADVGVPVVLYNVPGRTVISMNAETVGRLAAHENVVAIKEATGDMRFGTAVMAAGGDRITYLSGDDFTTHPFVAMGGHGCISVVSNVAPGLMHDLVVAARDGDVDRGRALHRKANRIGALCFADSNPMPTKHMLSLMGVCGHHARLPMVPISSALSGRIEAMIKEEGLLEGVSRG